MVALIAVLSSAARKAYRKTVAPWRNARAPPAKRTVSQAAATASIVLPAAMPIDDGTWPLVVTFTTNAPTRTAGQRRSPYRRSAAMAMPVGGQTGLTLALTDARSRPILPAATYTAIRARSRVR